MKTVYVLSGYGAKHDIVYATRELAEKAEEKYNRGNAMCGSNIRAYVKEVQFVTN